MICDTFCLQIVDRGFRRSILPFIDRRAFGSGGVTHGRNQNIEFHRARI
jgi:hypothetical protein